MICAELVSRFLDDALQGLAIAPGTKPALIVLKVFEVISFHDDIAKVSAATSAACTGLLTPTDACASFGVWQERAAAIIRSVPSLSVPMGVLTAPLESVFVNVYHAYLDKLKPVARQHVQVAGFMEEGLGDTVMDITIFKAGLHK
jgi:hypothetical protein